MKALILSLLALALIPYGFAHAEHNEAAQGGDSAPQQQPRGRLQDGTLVDRLKVETVDHGEYRIKVQTFKSPPFNPSILFSNGHIAECKSHPVNLWGKSLLTNSYNGVSRAWTGLKNKIISPPNNCAERVETVKAALVLKNISPTEIKCEGSHKFLIRNGLGTLNTVSHNLEWQTTYMSMTPPNGDYVQTADFVYTNEGGKEHLYNHVGTSFYECPQKETYFGQARGDSFGSPDATKETGFIEGDPDAWAKAAIKKYRPGFIANVQIYKGEAYYIQKAREKVERLQPVFDAMRKTNLCEVCPNDVDQLVPKNAGQ